jgi:hypothetical protein
MLRHKPQEHPLGVSPDVRSAIEFVDRHIEQHVGPVAMVFHEIVSDVVHIDIHHVEPGPNRPFHTLVTSGMSDLPMSPPSSAPTCTYAELVALLPPSWLVTQEAFADEANYWPLRQLKVLARLPHEYNTWLWSDHTVPNGDPPKPFAPSTKLCCSFLLPSISLGHDFLFLDTRDGRRITFFALMPLYREELEYKLKAGSDALIDRFDEVGVSDVINPQRPNVCRPGRKRLFRGGA